MFNLPDTFALACYHSFFGLKPWYEYLKLDSDCDVTDFNFFPAVGNPSDVPLILLAIVDDLLRIAGLVAVAFVLVGAFKLVSSQGNPEEAAKAQDTIINALIGLAIAVIAVVFVAFIGHRLGA